MSKLDGLVITVGASVTIVPDGSRYLSFPACVRAANGSLVGAYRSGDNHSANGYLRVIRSLDNGVTWSAPAAPFAIPGYDLGTASLSVLPDGRIFLATWIRSATTNELYPNGIRWSISEDNGVTWSAPTTLDTGAAFPLNSVTESPLCVADDGAWLLGVWSRGAGATSDYSAGVMRSTDEGATWTLTHLDESATLGFNENGVVNLKGRILLITRSLSEAHYLSASDDNGLTFTPDPPALVLSSNFGGAPRPTSIDGLAWFVIRAGAAAGGHRAQLAVTDGETVIAGPALNTEIGLGDRMLYGQAVKLGPGEIGVFWAKENSSGRAEIRFTRVTVTYATKPRHAVATYGATAAALDLLKAPTP